MGFPHIYIYCISISRVFSCFLTFFARFWILSIFCALYHEKWSFFKETRHLSDIAIFGFRFFRSHSKRWDFRFYRFFVFWPFFLIDTFFGSFNFLWIVFSSLIFYRFFAIFYRSFFWTVLVECGISRATFIFL